MPSRRTIFSVIALLAVVGVAWIGWVVWNTYRDLDRAEQAVDAIEAAIRSDDPAAREAAVEDFKDATSSAAGRTDGVTWSALTILPFFGDDAEGVRALSESLDVLATGAIDPLNDVVDSSDGVVVDGRIDVDTLSAMQAPIQEAKVSLVEATDLVDDRDSSGYMGRLRSRFDEYVDRVSDLSHSMGAVDTAVDLLPAMLGSEGERDYLLIFQNNAEIRATGGLPGSWAHLHAADGKLELVEQGSANDFQIYEPPLGDLTEEEKAIFGREMGIYFQDPNFTPDFPRAAQVFDAFWQEEHADVELDGILSMDVVALSYLLRATGPVTSGDLTITSDNAVQTLLSDVYEEPDTSKQDAIFARIARDIFTAFTSGVGDPIDIVEELGNAAQERRLLVAPFVPEEAEVLAGTEIHGELQGDAGAVPQVDVALNDLTASKMSYYLRYYLDLQTVSCSREGVQDIQASMTFSQTISPQDARKLPEYVTGVGRAEITPGDQFVRFHVFGPFGGAIDPESVRIDGKKVIVDEGLMLNGRPVVTLAAYIESLDDVVVTWSMESAPGQTEDVEAHTTPSIVSGATVDAGPSGC